MLAQILIFKYIKELGEQIWKYVTMESAVSAGLLNMIQQITGNQAICHGITQSEF